jgi:hypothetical protein
MEKDRYNLALALLESDTAKHLATLKYLSLYGGDAVVNILEEGKGWAVLALFPTTVLSFDQQAYPRAKVAVFANGNNTMLQQQLLQSLPADNYVLRLNEPVDLSGLEPRYHIKRGFTYLSYSCDKLTATPPPVMVPAQSKLTKQAIRLFGENGHSREDLEKYFAHGARWFGYVEDDVIKSICFVYQDYGNYREIAGVRTLDTERRKGYARIVVYSALKYLLDNGLTPRYVTEIKNTNSNALAESLGMKRFLKIEHYLLEPK